MMDNKHVIFKQMKSKDTRQGPPNTKLTNKVNKTRDHEKDSQQQQGPSQSF